LLRAADLLDGGIMMRVLMVACNRSPFCHNHISAAAYGCRAFPSSVQCAVHRASDGLVFLCQPPMAAHHQDLQRAEKLVPVLEKAVRARQGDKEAKQDLVRVVPPYL